METLEDLYRAYIVPEGKREKKPSRPYKTEDFMEVGDTVGIRKLFLKFAKRLTKAAARDLDPEWKVCEVPKAFYCDGTDYIIRDSQFARYSDFKSVFWNDWMDRVRSPLRMNMRCRQSTTPIPDSVYFFRKWSLQGSDVKLRCKKIADIPLQIKPERMPIGYFPYNCNTTKKRKQYLKERYDESVREHAFFHCKVLTSELFVADRIRMDELLLFHQHDRHLHGFFKCERNIKSSRRYLIDIYNRFKFPLDSPEPWTEKMTDDFDRLNNYYQNFSQFVRINHKTLLAGIGKYDYIDQVVTSSFLHVYQSPKVTQKCPRDQEVITISDEDQPESSTLPAKKPRPDNPHERGELFREHFASRNELLTTRLGARDEVPRVDESDGIPCLILKLLESENSNSLLIRDILQMDPQLLDLVGPFTKDFELFPKVVLTVCRIRQLSERRVDNASRPLLDKLQSVVNVVRRKNRTTSLIELRHMRDHLNVIWKYVDDKETSEVWHMMEPILSTTYELVKQNRLLEPLVERFDDCAAGLEEKLNQESVSSEETHADRSLVEWLIRAKKACQQSAVETFSSRAQSSLAESLSIAESSRTKKVFAWKQQKDTEEYRRLDEKTKYRLEDTYLDVYNQHSDICCIIKVAMKANHDGRCHVAGDLTEIVERMMQPTYDVVPSRKVPPELVSSLKHLCLFPDIYGEDIREIVEGLEIAHQLLSESDTYAAQAIEVLNYKCVTRLISGTEETNRATKYASPFPWQFNAVNILVADCEKSIENGHIETAIRAVEAARKVVGPLLIDWKNSVPIKDRDAIQEAVSEINELGIPEDEVTFLCPPKAEFAIKALENLENPFWERVAQVIRLAEISEALGWNDGVKVAKFIANVVIRNDFRNTADSKSWLVVWSSTMSDRDLNRSFHSEKTHPLASFLYPFWKSLSLSVAARNRQNVKRLADVLRSVLRKQTTDLFVKMLECLEQNIRFFASLPENFDEEVLARLVQFGMDLLASYRRSKKVVRWNDATQFRSITPREKYEEFPVEEGIEYN